MIEFKDSTFLKLKPDSAYGEKVGQLLIAGESVLDSYRTVRDGVVFTDKRIILINVKGMTGKKQEYTSIPYSRIHAYSVETAGSFDRDAELEIYVNNIGKIRFEFKAKSKILEISRYISMGLL